MHAGAVGALEVVIVDDGHFRVGIAARRPTVDRVNGLRILADFELLQPRQCVAVFLEQESDGGLLAIVREGDGQVVESRNIVLCLAAQGDVVVRRHVELRAHQYLDAALYRGIGRRGLGPTTETDDGGQGTGEDKLGTEQTNRLSLQDDVPFPIIAGPGEGARIAGRKPAASSTGPNKSTGTD